MEEVKVCIGYKIGNKFSELLPVGAEDTAQCEPVYEDMPGWDASTVGAKHYEALPNAARQYLEKIQSILGVPIDMISTGPDREETIVLRHPYH